MTDPSIANQFENLYLFLFRKNLNGSVILDIFNFYISNIKEYEYFTIESPLYDTQG